MKHFLEHYVADKKTLDFAYNRLKQLPIDRIYPQHGDIITKNISVRAQGLKNYSEDCGNTNYGVLNNFPQFSE